MNEVNERIAKIPLKEKANASIPLHRAMRDPARKQDGKDIAPLKNAGWGERLLRFAVVYSVVALSEQW